MSALQLAEDLAAQGLPVFPCTRKKAPACEHGFKDAVCAPEAVRALWRRSPAPLIGVPTGASSGFDVLDIDPRHGGDQWWRRASHLIPPTRIHRTGSGGLHVFFRHQDPVRNTESKIAPGVDTRGEGGYIIWWPADGAPLVPAPVAPWPKWLLRRLLCQPKPTKKAAQFTSPLDGSDVAQAMAARALDRVAKAPEGQRHYALRAAACTIGGLLDRLPFGEEEAKERLRRAAEQAGAEDLANAERTAAWGLAKGQQSPLQLEARP